MPNCGSAWVAGPTPTRRRSTRGKKWPNRCGRCISAWPHAGRSSFVTLLADKAVETDGVALEKAVGLRLAFRQRPPIQIFSDQFLFYLNGTLASTAYQTWAHLSPDPVSSLPPERFSFQVVSM